MADGLELALYFGENVLVECRGGGGGVVVVVDDGGGV